MRPTASRLRLTALAALVAVALAACAAPAAEEPPADPEAQLKADLAELPGVASVEIGGMEPADENPRYTTVTFDAGAERDDVLATAEQVPGIAAGLEWEDPITLTADAPESSAAAEATFVEPWWSFEITPETDAATARGTVGGLLDAAEVDGVVGLAFIDGWPYAALLEPDRVAERFDALMETALFAQGGSFALRSEQPLLRFSHLEGVTSRNLIDELVAITTEYPHAEVLLEGPQHPKLYIARVTTAEAETIAGRLVDPDLREGVEPGDGALPWQITSPDGDGSGFWEGEVGAG
ncbi:hypothetical protein ACFQ58_11075 [Agromyces sp. NPDC056523]|uniref:hypothetical protein n=1 Tax=Agromyces sp. NPDC056523 TaxID=3345850 RepID=UPI00366F9599